MAEAKDTLEYVTKLKDAEGFPLWSFQIEIHIGAADLLDMINVVPTADQTAKPEWKKKDFKAKKIIVSTIEQQALIHVIACKTSYDMWSRLRDIYERDSQHHKCALLQEFYEYNYKKDKDITSIIAELNNIVYKLRNLGQIIDDDMVMTKIMSALPENYRSFITAWDSTPATERNLTNLTARLLLEESRNNSNKDKAAAFKTNEKTCYKCNKRGHLASNCKKNQTIKNKEVKCFTCNMMGHIAKNCRTKSKQCSKKGNHSEKDCYFRKRDKNNDKGESSNVVFLTGNDETTEWTVDSGSTSHMTNDFNLLQEACDISVKIGVANKDGVTIAQSTGKVNLGECGLERVMYVPDLKSNLLSVSAITKRGGSVHFNNDIVTVLKDNKIVLEGRMNSEEFYIIKSKECVEKSMITKGNQNVKLWHSRLGHLGIHNMLKLLDITHGLKLSKTELMDQSLNCEICIKSNQVRTAFGNERRRATRPLEIIHTDVCGPITPTTWDGMRYFISFLDDFTNFGVVYLMKSKSEAFSKIKEFVMPAEAKLDKRTAELRCDNGLEYINENVKNWCKNRGIFINNTTAYTPQLNGKSERLNRTLVEKTRAMIKGENGNKNLWGEGVRVAMYLHNRSPTKNNACTSYEMWNNKRPNLENLRTFGCKAYAKNLGQIKKLDDRSKITKFVGYAQNGYRLWDPVKRNIIVSRDVKFIEDDGEFTVKGRESTSSQSNEKIKIHAGDDSDKEKEDSDDEDDNIEEDSNSSTSEEDEGNTTIINQIVEEEEINKNEPRRSKRERRFPDKYEGYAYLTYSEVMKENDKKSWVCAMKDEMRSLEKNKTWKFVDISEANGKKCISSRWTFQRKDDGRYKARLVVRGCEQQKDIDYAELYSPVVETAALRILFGLAAYYNWHYMKFDIKTAFLHGKINEEIYIRLAEGYKCPENKACKLRKAIYGLRQASNCWNREFCKALKQQGFRQMKIDKCIFKKGDNEVVMAIHVDDGIISGKTVQDLEDILKGLSNIFEITKERNPDSFLGLEIKRQQNEIKISQRDYIEKILDVYGMSQAKAMDTHTNAGEY